MGNTSSQRSNAQSKLLGSNIHMLSRTSSCCVTLHVIMYIGQASSFEGFNLLGSIDSNLGFASSGTYPKAHPYILYNSFPPGYLQYKPVSVSAHTHLCLCLVLSLSLPFSVSLSISLSGFGTICLQLAGAAFVSRCTLLSLFCVCVSASIYLSLALHGIGVHAHMYGISICVSLSLSLSLTLSLSLIMTRRYILQGKAGC